MNMFSDMKIGKRIGLGYAIILSLLVLTAGVAIWRLQSVADATRDMMQHPLAKERLISDWYRNIHSGVRRTSAIAKSTDPTLTAFFADDAAESTRTSTEYQSKINTLLVGDREKFLFKEIGEQRAIYLGLRDAINKAKADGQIGDANRLFEQEFIPASNKYLDLTHALLEEQRKSINATALEIDSIYQTGSAALIAIGLFALVCGALAATLLIRGLLKQLGGDLAYATEITSRIAAGDLSTEIRTGANDKSSLLFAIKTMRDSLASIVAQVRSGTDTIATASVQIAAGNLDLSSRTEQQASSLQETAAAMEQLTSTVKQNADNAHQANQLAVSASDVAVKGGAVVSQVIDTMDSINDSSRKIADIINVIDGIAFQTNILALNAAVEAARAGEQGRGFAVVAAEVRNLARRSAGAAKAIKQLIDDSVEKVDAGAILVDQAGATMDEIVASVKQVTDIMSDITAASQEQTAGIDQINRAISQMDEVTQQNAALVEQAAAAAESLSDQAGSLTQVVNLFRLDSRQAMTPPPAVAETYRSAQVVQLAAKNAHAPVVPKTTVDPTQFRKLANASGIYEQWDQY